MLIEQKAFVEAERLLAFVLSNGGPRILTLLALEQLFTPAEKPALAVDLHRQCLEALAKNADRTRELREPEPLYRFCTDATVPPQCRRGLHPLSVAAYAALRSALGRTGP